MGIALCLGARVTTRLTREALIAVDIAAIDVQTPERHWIWRDRIQKGKLVYLEGPPGAGKTTVQADIIARYSRVWPMPLEEEAEDGAIPPRTIIYVGDEDGYDEIKQRFLTAGGDVERLRFFRGFRREDQDDLEAILQFREHMPELRDYLYDQNAGILALDSLLDGLSAGTDTNAQGDVRKSLIPLIRVLGETGVTCLAIRHDNKVPKSAITAAGGSTAFSALGRSALRFGVDPGDSDLRILAVGKHNNSARAPSLAFRITGDGSYPRVEWVGESPYSAEELILLAGEARNPTKTEQAVNFLTRELRRGPQSATVLKERASELGLAGSLDRAADELGVRRQRIGFGKGGHVEWERQGGPPPSPHTQQAGPRVADAEYAVAGSNGAVEGLDPKKLGSCPVTIEPPLT